MADRKTVRIPSGDVPAVPTFDVDVVDGFPVEHRLGRRHRRGGLRDRCRRGVDGDVRLPGHGPPRRVVGRQDHDRHGARRLVARQESAGAAVQRFGLALLTEGDPALGGLMIGAVGVDQSAFVHLDQFDALSGRNAQTLFQQMEWE